MIKFLTLLYATYGILTFVYGILTCSIIDVININIFLIKFY